MVYKLTLKISHHSFQDPVVKEHYLEGPSLSSIVKQIKISSAQANDLKTHGEITWVDAHNVIHELSLTNMAAAPTPPLTA